MIDCLTSLHDPLQVTGQHIEVRESSLTRKVLGFENSTVCLETILGQCYTEMSDAEMDHMFLHAPEVIRTVRTDGVVTDKLLDALEVCKLPDGKHINRDGLVTWRQHAMVLSHVSSKEKFVDYLRMRTEKNDPAFQLRKKEEEQALKVIQRAAAAKAKEDLALVEKASKIAVRLAVKERRNSLSAEDRKAEDTEKKEEAARKKAKKQAEADEKLRIAVGVVERSLVEG